MLKRIKVQDFQSHKNTELILHPCFNIITGHSGAGKTAFLRALNALFYNNMAGTSFIRIDHKEQSLYYEIAAVTDDNDCVGKLRSVKDNKYYLYNKVMIDESQVLTYRTGYDQVFDNVKTDVPEEIRKRLNIYPVKIDANKEVNIQYCGQFDPPFMLMEPDSNKMKFLNAMAGTYAVDLAVKDANRLVLNNRKNNTAADTAITKLQMEVNEYTKKLDILETANKYLADKEKELKEMQEQKALLDGIQAKSVDLQNKFKKLNAVTALFEDEKFTGITEKVQQLRKFFDLKRDYADLLSKFKQLNDAEKLLSGIDFDKALADIEKYKTYVKLQAEYDGLHSKYKVNKTSMEAEQKTLDNHIEQYAKLLEEVKVCPICHSTINDDIIGHIKESLQ